MEFIKVKEKEFKFIAEHKGFAKVLAQESQAYPERFHLIGINENKAYVIRHGRTDDIRTWKMNSLIQLAKELKINNLDVSLIPQT